MAGQLRQTALPGLEAKEINIFTIGYGGKNFHEFQAELKAHGINQIIDVRSDNHTEYFGGAFMRAAFKDNYIPRPALGGLHWHQSQYKQWRSGAHVQEALEEIKEWAQQAGARIALMCAEKDHRQCHRFYFVARALKETGIEARHL